MGAGIRNTFLAQAAAGLLYQQSTINATLANIATYQVIHLTWTPQSQNAADLWEIYFEADHNSNSSDMTLEIKDATHTVSKTITLGAGGTRRIVGRVSLTKHANAGTAIMHYIYRNESPAVDVQLTEQVTLDVNTLNTINLYMANDQVSKVINAYIRALWSPVLGGAP